MKPNTADKIFNEIQIDIIKGVYSIGEKLPPERDLAKRYDTNRFAIREAIAMLSKVGFVHTLPQSGTFIKDYLNEAKLDLLIQIILVKGAIDKNLVTSLLSFRQLIEIQAVNEAVNSLSDKDIEVISSNLDIKSSHLDDFARQTECDYKIHFTIIASSGNLIYMIIYKSFITVYRHIAEFFYSIEGAPEKSLYHNRQLLKALKDRNQEQAKKSMSKILKYAEKRILKEMDDKNLDRIKFSSE